MQNPRWPHVINQPQNVKCYTLNRKNPLFGNLEVWWESSHSLSFHNVFTYKEYTHIFLRPIGNKTLITLLISRSRYTLLEDALIPSKTAPSGSWSCSLPPSWSYVLSLSTLETVYTYAEVEGTTATVRGIPTWFHISEEFPQRNPALPMKRGRTYSKDTESVTPARSL